MCRVNRRADLLEPGWLIPRTARDDGNEGEAMKTFYRRRGKRLVDLVRAVPALAVAMAATGSCRSASPWRSASR
jgi:peptidoglycan/LPS O-acetylase OafA/YrhL